MGNDNKVLSRLGACSLFIFPMVLWSGDTVTGKSPATFYEDICETVMDDEKFDFIVIGTGPAGAVISNSLTADGHYRVLVLEAGANNDTDPLIVEPDSNLSDHYPEFFWPGLTVPQKGIGDRTLNIGHGRTSGGGSSVNGEMYVRPTPFVLNKWVEAAGDKWSPENATRHFRELEKFSGASAREDIHGYNGELDIRQNLPHTPPFVEKFVTAVEKATGHAPIDDYNDPRTPIGPFARYQLYQRPDGSRASASVSFLNQQVRSRPGLTILNEATVHRILFTQDKTAEGVEYIHKGVSKRAYADKKVIVSAGIHSPQILMLSGIGPRELLEKYGIPVIHDNPTVGSGLATDSYSSATFRMNMDDAAGVDRSDPHAKWPGGAFLPAPDATEGTQERCIQLLTPIVDGETLVVGFVHVNPKSRGTIQIQSADPLKMVLVDYNFLSDPSDLELMKKVLRTYLVQIANELHSIDPSYELVSPTLEILADDEKLKQHIQSTYTTAFHDQGTLRMGSESDGAVVNHSGEVYGVRNLTVADAQIIPYHMDGNTSASAYLIGSVIAEEILSSL